MIAEAQHLDAVHTKLAVELKKIQSPKAFGGIQALKADNSNYAREMKAFSKFECMVTRLHLPMWLVEK